MVFKFTEMHYTWLKLTHLTQVTYIHTHVRLLDERLTDRNLNNDTARPNVSFKMQL